MKKYIEENFETIKQDFENLKSFIQEMKFDRLGIFEYSREKGTYSYDLPNRVPAKIKHKRKNVLMKIQKDISHQINQNLIHKKIECIVEYVMDDNTVVARTYKDAPEVDCLAYLTTNNDVLPGDIVQARITNIEDYDIYGIVD